jgi:putative hydrolase of the HAD superfamily
MVHLEKIKHIFFDLDDTLWDFETNSEKVLQELFIETELDKKLNNDFYTFLVAYKKRNIEKKDT